MEVLTCSVCSEVFDGDVREPVMLPQCGHTFCRPCLLNLQDTEPAFKCPTCRRRYSGPHVVDLPVVYMILDIVATYAAMKAPAEDLWEACQNHGDPVRLWCHQCQEALCGQCLFERHMTDRHHVVKTQTALEQQKHLIQLQADRLTKYINMERKRLTNEFRKVCLQLANIYSQSMILGEHSKTITGILEATEKTEHMKTLVINRRILNKLLTELKATVSTTCDPQLINDCIPSENRTDSEGDTESRLSSPGFGVKSNFRKAPRDTPIEAGGHDSDMEEESETLSQEDSQGIEIAQEESRIDATQEESQIDVAQKESQGNVSQKESTEIDVNQGQMDVAPEESQKGLAQEGSHRDVAQEGSHRDVAQEGSHRDVTQEGSHRDVAQEGSHRDVAQKGSHRDVAQERSHRDVAQERSHRDVAQERSHRDVSQERSHRDVAKEGSHGDVAQEGSHRDVAQEGNHRDVAKEGSHGDVAQEGSHRDVAQEGSHRDVAQEGSHRDVAQEGSHRDVAQERTHKDVAQEGSHRDVAQERTHKDVAQEGSHRDVDQEGNHKDMAQEGSRGDVAQDGSHRDIDQEGNRINVAPDNLQVPLVREDIEQIQEMTLDDVQEPQRRMGEAGSSALGYSVWQLTRCTPGGSAHWPKLSWGHFMAQLPVVQLLVPPEKPQVFLQLGVGGRSLGSVHIRLWGHLRRAQHFLALCLGTLGPSYKGSRFMYVARKGQPGERLVGGVYVVEGGGSSSHQLMEDLEWRGEYLGPAKEGIVGGSRGRQAKYNSCFCISSRDNPTGQYYCPFGQVVSGLEVVRAAVQHHPVSDVTIMDTGLVSTRE
ncbi:hypothetical protein OTU49_002625 [Cherax quadricarinatus]|uniref:Uncharacterized protein n=1 Tax=Cherax quadricarinatus TaxID=27406 RepID=A0AAW0XTP2_CHEQU